MSANSRVGVGLTLGSAWLLPLKHRAPSHLGVGSDWRWNDVRPGDSLLTLSLRMAVATVSPTDTHRRHRVRQRCPRRTRSKSELLIPCRRTEAPARPSFGKYLISGLIIVIWVRRQSRAQSLVPITLRRSAGSAVLPIQAGKTVG